MATAAVFSWGLVIASGQRALQARKAHRSYSRSRVAHGAAVAVVEDVSKKLADPYRTDTSAILFPHAEDRLGIDSWDHVEMIVGNARQAAAYFQACLGFQPIARQGLETGCKDRVSYVLAQGEIIVVLTSALEPGGEMSRHHEQHGDGVRRIAFRVSNAVKAHEEAVAAGATEFLAPCRQSDSSGEVVMSGIHVYGDTVHLFVDRSCYKGVFLPGFEPWTPEFQPMPVGLQYIDHVVANVGWNEMELWSSFYQRVFGMSQLVSFDDKDISTEFTALRSVVMTTRSGRVKLPINEPAEGRRKSQIEEFLDFYKGPGVQHIALASSDIVETVSAMRARGVEFLSVPDAYYDQLEDRVGSISEEVEILRRYRILVDRDDHGYMLQIFTRPLADRPTLFFEVIQRQGGRSFGKGNFKALFESIEEEQRRRGTL